jgi:hypothetical protein
MITEWTVNTFTILGMLDFTRPHKSNDLSIDLASWLTEVSKKVSHGFPIKKKSTAQRVNTQFTNKVQICYSATQAQLPVVAILAQSRPKVF